MLRRRGSPPPLAGGKLAALTASIWIQCSAGSSYCFGIYSPLLKSSQGYDQSTLDSVAFFKDVGANAGVISGILSSSFPSVAWPVLLAGVVLNLAGYLPMCIAVSGELTWRPGVMSMCFFMLLAAQAQTFFNTADVVTAVENFPSHRGTVIGIMKGFLGLSGAILVQIYRTFCNNNASSFLLMLSLFPTLLPFFLMYFVRVYPQNGANNKHYLDSFSIVTLLIASFLFFSILVENFLTLSSSAQKAILLILVFLLLSPLLIAIQARLRVTNAEPEISSHEAVGLLLRDPEEDLNISQAISTLNFWLLFTVVSCGLGSGLATVNNISQMAGSLGYSDTETNTLVSLWSIWNFTGRFVLGYVSDHFLRSWAFPRPLFLVLALAAMSVGHSVLASGLVGGLYFGSALVGICYGSIWVLMPTITSEIFGLRHFGTIFNTIAIASPVGSYILSVKVVGYIYDIEAASSPTLASSPPPSCQGKHCFMSSFIILASVCLLGCAFSVVFFFRTRRFYRHTR